jgi:hypothetical protein
MTTLHDDGIVHYRKHSKSNQRIYRMDVGVIVTGTVCHFCEYLHIP